MRMKAAMKACDRCTMQLKTRARAITAHTGERLSDAEINRCLPRLDANGFLIGDGPKRHKTYRLTRAGTRQLGAEKRTWARIVLAVGRVLAAE